MVEPTVARYGEWPSPITAATVSATGRRLGFPRLVGEEVWWSEDRPTEAGRTTVLARGRDGAVRELLPAPWSARSRVHEYGGLPYLGVPANRPEAGDGPRPAAGGAALVFANFADQRLFRLDPGTDEPVPLTPPSPGAALRYADLLLGPDGTEVWCVRERLWRDAVDRQLVAVPLDGKAGEDPGAVREIVAGSDFLAHPRVSPDGTKLAWLAWDHPRMPWDGTELRVGELDRGRVVRWSTVLGGPAESVFQPEWDGDRQLIAVTDRTGWWNLHRVAVDGGAVSALYPAEEEFGVPLWQLGTTTWTRLADGRLLCIHGTGTQRLGLLDPGSGALTDLPLPYPTVRATLAATGTRAVVVAGAPDRPSALLDVDLTTGRAEVVRTELSESGLPGTEWLPVPESTSLPGPDGRPIHVHIYPPRSPSHTGEPGTRPPYVVFVHGGPTSQSPAVLDLGKAYFTSRGIGVLDLNYRGSTGYGRAYREALSGAWGIADVADAEGAAAALVARGAADPARLAIRGGSAGGWTTLCAVTSSDTFAAGMSVCGVTDVGKLAETTHDFESRYVATLVGEAALVEDDRSPLPRAGRTRCPVLLLQGAEDPIVPLPQAERFADALAARGIRHALVVFPGEYHGFRRAASIAAALEAELSFYGQVLGFTPPGVPTLPLATSATNR